MKLSTLLCSAALFAPLGVAFAVPPDQAPANGNAGKSAADTAWDNLLTSVQQAPAADSRGSFIAALVGEADQFAAFANQNPGHAKNKEAKAWEGIMLGRAVIAGDTAHEARRGSVVSQLKKDKTVSTAVRLELFATSNTADIILAKPSGRDAFLAAHESATRSLIAEFPDQPIGYESLIGIARSGPEARSTVIARDVLAMSGVTDSAKADAQEILDRAATVGQSIAPLSGAGHAVVLYTWSAADTGSVKRAKIVAAKAPANVIFIGVNVDAVPADAASQGLPGAQVSSSDATVQRLMLTRSGLMYGADANGTIRSVHLDYDLGAAFLATNS